MNVSLSKTLRVLPPVNLCLMQIISSCVTWLCSLILVCSGTVSIAESVLPQGASPAALRSLHFPDRVHEFVWRNWNAVEVGRIAKIIGASTDEVRNLAESMGLPRNPVIPPEMMQRGYITLIRRNWHLLPYEQLLELLEMTPERLAVMLREEDFLWIKLGSLKPACAPVRYQPPDEAVQTRAAEIHRIIEEEFGNELSAPCEPRFDFVRQLATPLPSFSPPQAADESDSTQRIVYSYVAIYGDPLVSPELNPYPDGLLQRLSLVGINGVWIHALLRDLAPGGTDFPEFGEGHEQRLANLRNLVERAGKYGIHVYLYMNEPRAMPSSFFANRPEMAGVKEGDFTALCTSHPAVRKWMGDALAFVFREVPGLSGIYAITASENLTNCASHGDVSGCPRCKLRTDTEIIPEVVAILSEGVHRGNPQARVLISDWGWRGHGDARDLMKCLPGSITLMSVSEWNLPIERGGIKSNVGEYSISAVGPGPRSQAHWKVAREKGLKTGTEIQFNNTCEIATIPYLPVMDLVAEHCRNLLAVEKLDAMLIGWTMGGHPSPNFEIAQHLGHTPDMGLDGVLNKIAQERFGTEGAPYARKAWTLMSEAFREYPFHISVVYTSPVQSGPANPLYATKTGYSATMWGIPYDDLEGWRGPYPPEIFAAQFEKIAQGWQPGLEELHKAVNTTPSDRRTEVQADLRYAQAAAIHFQSVANQARYVIARDAITQDTGTLTVDRRNQLFSEIRQVLKSEIELSHQLFNIVREDSHIGFEPSCQYFYLPLDLVEKVINCRWLLQHFEGEEPSKGQSQ